MSEEGRSFLKTVKAGDLEAVKRMIQSNRDLLFAIDESRDSPVTTATDTHPGVADYLAHTELQRLQEGSVPEVHLYGAIHDLGEAAHAETGYRGCEALRAEAEPVIAGFLAHTDPQIRYIAVNVLAIHWDMKHYAKTFQQLALTDPEDDVRQIAVSAVGFLLRDSRDVDAARFVLGILRDPAQPAWIRESAYGALEEIWLGFGSSFALSQKRQREQTLRAASGKRLTEDTWEELADWDFVAQVEQVVRGKAPS